MNMQNLYWMAAFLLVSQYFVAADAQNALIEIPKTDGVMDEHFATYTIGFDGASKHRISRRQTIPGRMQLVDFLNDDVVKKELEIVDEQFEKLNKILKKIQFEKFQFLFRVQQYRGDQKKLREEIVEWNETSLAKLDKALLPHQWRRLGEIAFRCSIRQQGIYRLILHNPRELPLENYPRNKSALVAIGKKRQSFYRKKSDALRKEIIAQVIDVLTQSQQKMLKQIIGDNVGQSKTDLEVLVFQLQCATDDDRYKKFIGGDRFDIFFGVGDLIVQPNGQLGVYDSADAQWIRAGNAINNLNRIAHDKSVFGTAEIVENQRAEMKKVSRAAFGQSNKIAREITPDMLAAKTPEEKEKLNQLRIERQVDVLLPAIDDMKSKFLPHQNEIIQELQVRSEYLQTGIACSLLKGEVGRRLKVSDEQKKKLTKMIETMISEMTSEMIDIEDRIIREAIGHLHKTDAKVLLDALGEPLKQSPPNIGLMIHDMKFKNR